MSTKQTAKKAVTAKAAKGTVGIQARGNRLQFNLPRELFDGKQKRVMSVFPNTKEGMKLAQAEADVMNKDILYGRFDLSLEKYDGVRKNHLQVVESNPLVELNLLQLWDKYTEYKSGSLEEVTINHEYKYMSNLIKQLPTLNLDDAIAIRDFMMAEFKPFARFKLITHLNACCKWGVKSQLIDKNPFIDMVSDFKPPKKSRESIDPFTEWEMNVIIKAFEEHPKRNYYAPYIKFLFWTGCRTEEANGLRWGHLLEDYKYIHFCEAITQQRGRKYHKGIKNGKSRKFPINPKLKELLQSIKPADAKPEELVFKSSTGLSMNHRDFSARMWRGGNDGHGYLVEGIVTKLAEEGKIHHYRKVYATRHTFVTLALQKGFTVPQVAKWIGDTPQTILNNYAGVHDHIMTPEF